MSTTRNRMQPWLTVALVALLALVTTLPSQADETITYIHWDALGSPVAATDEAGNVVWRESYRPYGERIDNEAAAGDHSRWYTGHPQDEDTGLVYAGARYYDPVIGRFLAIDPVGFQEENLHSFNRYAYANNNPYGYVDPDGREGVGAAQVMQSEDRFTGAFGTSGSVQRATQQTATIIETADTISSVVMPAKGVVTFVGKQAAKGIAKAARGGVRANRSQGKAGEAVTEATLKQKGDLAGKQVTFETSTGQKSVIDFVTNSKGGKGIVETKTGNARLTTGQRQLFDDVQNGRPVIPRGKNAANAGLTPGRPTVLKSCGVHRPC